MLARRTSSKYQLVKLLFPAKFSTSSSSSVFRKLDPMLYKRQTTQDRVKLLLQGFNQNYKENEQEIIVRACMFCPKPHRDDPTNLHTLCIEKSSGLYHCFRCGAKGNYRTFESHMRELDKVEEAA